MVCSPSCATMSLLCDRLDICSHATPIAAKHELKPTRYLRCTIISHIVLTKPPSSPPPCARKYYLIVLNIQQYIVQCCPKRGNIFKMLLIQSTPAKNAFLNETSLDTRVIYFPFSNEPCWQILRNSSSPEVKSKCTPSRAARP